MAETLIKMFYKFSKNINYNCYLFSINLFILLNSLECKIIINEFIRFATGRRNQKLVQTTHNGRQTSFKLSNIQNSNSVKTLDAIFLPI